MKRVSTRLLVGARQVLAILILAALWSAPLVHRAEAGEPNLMRLVEFIQYVTPDGQLPVLCVNDEDGEESTGLTVCETCIAAAASSANEPELGDYLKLRLDSQPMRIISDDLCMVRQAVGVLRQRGPPAV